MTTPLVRCLVHFLRCTSGSKNQSFLHAPGAWVVPQYLPSATFILRELSHPCSRAGLIRWLVLLVCAAFFVLSGLLEPPSQLANANAAVSPSSTPILTFTTSTLQQLCDHVPEQTKEEYVDPVSGFGLVVGVSAALALWNNRPAWLKGLKGVKLVKRLTSDVQTDQKQANSKNNVTNKEERAFYLLVQLLTVMFSLGHYVLWSDVRPVGGFMCTIAARATLAVFYKPILPAMWYGFMHLLDDEVPHIYINGYF